MAQKIEVGHNWTADQWDWPLQHNDGVVKVINTNDKFEVGLEVQFFTPKEIEVKVQGTDLIVHCKHEERQDSHGKINREIFRVYHLPKDLNFATVKSQLTPAGVLVVSGEKKK